MNCTLVMIDWLVGKIIGTFTGYESDVVDVDVDVDAILMLAPMMNNYYHWITEGLPRYLYHRGNHIS